MSVQGEMGCPSLQIHVSKRWLFVISLLLLTTLVILGLVSWKYVWLYATRKPDPRPPTINLLQDPQTSKNPEILLREANRLAWLFNSPKAGPLYVRAEELFKESGGTRNGIYSRVGRIRAQAQI